MTKPTDLLTRTIASLKDAPSTAARRELIAHLESMDEYFPLGETVTFQCKSCGSDVPVKEVNCGTCVAKEPPVMVLSVDHLTTDQQRTLLEKLHASRAIPHSMVLTEAEMEHHLAGMVDLYADVIAFHEKFEVAYKGPPRLLPEGAPYRRTAQDSGPPPPPEKSLAQFRRDFLKEEAREYATATYRGNHALHLTADVEQKAKEVTKHLADALDAIIDTLYVVLGNAHLHGFDRDIIREAWRRVHAKNMEKVRVERAEDSKRGSIYDVVKPEGWTPADLTDLVAHHIHQTMYHVEVTSPNTFKLSSTPVNAGAPYRYEGIKEPTVLAGNDLEDPPELGEIAEPGGEG